MMKYFPNMKLSYTSDAKCETNVPNQWSVLLSQRRRWINSTVHNLFELMFLPQLCGVCCLSMRFVVLLDLFSTLVQPASVLYIGYLIYVLVSGAIESRTEDFPLVSIGMLAGVYGLQVIIFIVKKQWGQIFYMLMVRFGQCLFIQFLSGLLITLFPGLLVYLGITFIFSLYTIVFILAL
jgi:chitin synthase